jgi:hypothetical protein
MNLDYIDELVDVDKYYLYYKNKPILSALGLKNLKSKIKSEIDAPKDKIKVYVINFKKTTSNKQLFMIGCYRSTLTSNLALITDKDDLGQNITYSKTELENRKFRLTDIKKAIKLITEENMKGETNMSITQLIKLTT